MHFAKAIRAAMVLCASWAVMSTYSAARPFTVSDAVRAAHFGDPYGDTTEPLLFSPDGRYILANVERGVTETNRPESTVRVYRMGDVYRFVEHTKEPQVRPRLELVRSTFEHGPIITKIRWLRDSSGFAFLEKSSSGYARLFLADLKSKHVSALTPDRQCVVDFDVRDRTHYVYSVMSPAITEAAVQRSKSFGFIATGLTLLQLIFPVDKYPWPVRDSHKIYYDLKELWAVVGSRRFRVEDGFSGKPIALHWTSGGRALALSPDGNMVVTMTAVSFVPPAWRSEYPPPFPANPDLAPAGFQNQQSLNGIVLGSEYVLVDLKREEIRRLTRAPTGYSQGWRSNQLAEWSSDGKWIVLSNSFIPQIWVSGSTPTNYPCVTAIEVDTNNMSCVTQLREETKRGDEHAGRFIEDIGFEPENSSRLHVRYHSTDQPHGEQTYERADDGRWMLASSVPKSDGNRHLTLVVSQGLNQPPVLVAEDNATHLPRVIWNPNPQLKNIDLGRVSIFRWKDKIGRAWAGGLYLPAEYRQGQAYPLVVQTHGFEENEFRPEGMYPTAFAARSLAAAGIMVLQAPDCGNWFKSDEASCQMGIYESAVEELISMGMANPRQIGIIGFSRTCYSVLATLTRSQQHFAAASITDGLNMGYLQYMQYLEEANGHYSRDAETANQGVPFGDGLQKWFSSSPGFNMHKVHTPLQIVALGADSVLEMWEPYAALRFLHRPVDLVVLGDGTHTLSNPEQRLVSQQGTVDWFRFWLQDYEDPSPAKRVQYARWRDLRTSQEAGIPTN